MGSRQKEGPVLLLQRPWVLWSRLCWIWATRSQHWYHFNPNSPFSGWKVVYFNHRVTKRLCPWGTQVTSAGSVSLLLKNLRFWVLGWSNSRDGPWEGTGRGVGVWAPGSSCCLQLLYSPFPPLPPPPPSSPPARCLPPGCPNRLCASRRDGGGNFQKGLRGGWRPALCTSPVSPGPSGWSCPRPTSLIFSSEGEGGAG